MSRQGLSLAAPLLAAALSAEAEAASRPLIEATIHGVIGNVPERVATLAAEALGITAAMKLKVALGLSLLLGVATGGVAMLTPRAMLSSHQQTERPAAPSKADKKAAVRVDCYGDPLPSGAVARLGSLRLYHGAVDVRQVVLSPDGKLVTSTNDKGVNKLWDVQTGRELPLAEHLRRAFLFTANGQLLGVGQDDRLWDLATGKEVPTEGIDIAAARKRREPGRRETLSPDGTIIAVWGDKGVRLLDARTRKELPPLQDQLEERNGWPLCFSPDGKLLAVPYFVNSLPGVRLWDLATRKEARWLRGKDYQIFGTAFSADGKIIAAADGGGVTLWDANTGKWLYDPGHTYCVRSLAFTPDGKTLLTGATYNDLFLRLWDPFSGRSRGKWKGHELGILAILVTADGKHVISTGQDGTVRLWDLASGKEIGRIGDDKIMAWAAALSPDGKLLATGGKGIQLWDLATHRKVRSFGEGTVLHMAFSPDGTKLASSASDDPTVRLWKVASGEELRQFKGLAGGARLGFSPDGRMLAADDSDGVIHLWDHLTGKELRRLGQPLKPGPRSAYVLGALTFSPDGRVVAAGYSDQIVRLLEVATGKERARYQGHRRGIFSLVFSPDGRLLASGSWDRTIMVWDVTGSVCLAKPERIALDAKARERLWTDLADSDAAKAYQAMRVLLGSEQTVSLLKKRLRPAASADPARINRLVVELDSDDFAVREKATQELAALGDRAEPLLRKALPKASPEARRRIEDILARIDPASSGELLRGLRAVEVLEQIGTTDARQLLKILADGAPEARLTREAKASLRRLNSRSSSGG